jgi:hypothetical protein
MAGWLVVSSVFLLRLFHERLFGRTMRIFANTGGTGNRLRIDRRCSPVIAILDRRLGMRLLWLRSVANFFRDGRSVPGLLDCWDMSGIRWCVFCNDGMRCRFTMGTVAVRYGLMSRCRIAAATMTGIGVLGGCISMAVGLIMRHDRRIGSRPMTTRIRLTMASAGWALAGNGLAMTG